MAKITHLILVVPSCRLLLIILLSASLLLIDVDETHACSCMPISPSEAFDNADMVFSGIAKERTIFYRPSADVYQILSEGIYNSEAAFELEVTSIWKGNPHEHIYIVNTVHPCGWGFALGKEYLVYAQVRDDHLTTSGCGRTRPLASAQEGLDALGEGQPPEAGTRAPRPSIMDRWLDPHAMIQKLARSQSKLLAELERERSRQLEPTATPASTPEPTPTIAPTVPPAPTQEPAGLGAAAGTPAWPIPTIAGVAGVFAGVLGTTLLMRRRWSAKGSSRGGVE